MPGPCEQPVFEKNKRLLKIFPSESGDYLQPGYAFFFGHLNLGGKHLLDIREMSDNKDSGKIRLNRSYRSNQALPASIILGTKSLIDNKSLKTRPGSPSQKP